MIIGRFAEQEKLNEIYKADEARFLAIYGRRRVGKTFLIKSFFAESECYLFEVSGKKDQVQAQQLATFGEAFSKTYLNSQRIPPPSSWKEAFLMLSERVNQLDSSKKHIIFLDELPWLAANRSALLSELDHAWNTKWQYLPNLVLIVCGSAAAWIINKVINNKAGLYNRLTDIIHLKPFSLNEAQTFLESRGFQLSAVDVLEFYLALGGVPHYLKLASPKLSVAQNLEQLFFSANAQLKDEYSRLFESLFVNHELHRQVVTKLANSPSGLSRQQLKISASSSTLTRVLSELEASNFIQVFVPFGKRSRDSFYRLIDEFSLFYHRWCLPAKGKLLGSNYWINQQQGSAWRSWAGYSFEGVCEKHYPQIIKALGISGVQSTVSKWRFSGEPNLELEGVQIDLVIDRADNIINLCEIKFTTSPLIVDKFMLDKQRKRHAIFAKITKTKKSLMPVLITVNGALKNQYLDSFAKYVVVLEDLMRD